MTSHVLIGLGSSLGLREQNLRFAHYLLDAVPTISVIKSSRIYHSVPLGGIANAVFYNQCAVLKTMLSPYGLLSVLQDIERRAGRVESRRWADRILDLDILLFEDMVIKSADLNIPHKGLALRSFVLQPAKDIAGEWFVPTLGCALHDVKVPLPRCW